MDKSQRKLIGKAVRFLRTIYEIDALFLSKRVGYSRCYQLQLESGVIEPSDNAINKYSNYFKLSPDEMLKIGNCQTLINAFKYLQSMGRF